MHIVLQHLVSGCLKSRRSVQSLYSETGGGIAALSPTPCAHPHQLSLLAHLVPGRSQAQHQPTQDGHRSHPSVESYQNRQNNNSVPLSNGKWTLVVHLYRRTCPTQGDARQSLLRWWCRPTTIQGSGVRRNNTRWNCCAKRKQEGFGLVQADGQWFHRVV